MPRDKVILVCVECGRHNYVLSKNKQSHPQRMEVKKFCAGCNKHTMHKETR